jgi:DNA-binding transcriptional ArsR family regulator
MKITPAEQQTASFLKALSSPTRVAILYRLNGKRSVGEIAASMDASHSAVSHQLKVLRWHGIVEAKRESREQIYSVVDSKRGKAVRAALDLV